MSIVRVRGTGVGGILKRQTAIFLKEKVWTSDQQNTPERSRYAKRVQVESLEQWRWFAGYSRLCMESTCTVTVSKEGKGRERERDERGGSVVMSCMRQEKLPETPLWGAVALELVPTTGLGRSTE